MSPRITSRLIAEFAAQPGPVGGGDPPDLAVLTEREREVLGLWGGVSNAEIAEQLYVSVATAKTHVSRVLTKLHARDRAQLVVVAYESGLISPGAA